MKPQILGTGISIRKRAIPGQKGFTLLEILVVVVIVVITVSAIVFSTTLSRGDHDLKLLGNDLSKLIHQVYQEAIFENQNFAISLYPGGFKVLAYNGEQWLVSEQSFFKKIKIGENHESMLTVDNLDVELEDEESTVPHILILASGEMSTFEWQIVDNSLNSKIILQGDLLGNVLMLGPLSLSDV
ncbi:MAG: prepilin-type N-terminal cleavage/methylation domain-containing protein [Gammaproteobacteria bacterium]|nr:prepilin-type N-terminal cleavage/methylation domain-containing protein [Gammaproteobacteria bacterium]